MRHKRRPQTEPQENRPEVVGFLGIGLDTDGHRRVTRAGHFIIVGGSAGTHERMQETAVKFEEALDKAGKRLKDVSPEEAEDVLRGVREGS